ncbi:hypothetical protein [Hoylesella timonensis]|uniref:Uncharacterized protein n=1 Tax=Hoylesella timonensis CRIS 5C-B1 TaxID=679189 RepID=D1VXG4_9BACT|nr:hypothetical protein [Hoylesella timonensis]EFA98124.1 hypothetical protein HMPREF9019_0900 [Hoylesella timonensis CRIS 5C-B1]
MNSRVFFDKVALMRRLQQEYFKTRSKTVLEQCKAVEKEVDVEIKRVNAILGNQPIEKSLFR